MSQIAGVKRAIMEIIISALKKLVRGQDSWLALYKVSLKQMNYGNNGDFDRTGELNILKYMDREFGKELPITIFDVGANVGDYAQVLVNYFGSRATIHSFEPSAKTYELFIKSTRAIPNIIPNQFGLSDSENTQLLFTNHEGSVWASVYKRNLDRYGMSLDQSEEIKLSTIDIYCRVNKIERIHFLKLDIEGHELSALRGAQQMIMDRKIDLIQFEFSSGNIDSRTYLQDFYQLLYSEYRIFRILQDGLHDMKEYQESYEIFVTTNYLAIKR